MKYTDESIIRELNRYKTEEQGDIETGVWMKEELLIFKQQMLFDEKMSIMLPEKFIDMPLDQARIKYPAEQRPQIIKTNQTGTINFTFSLLDVKTENKNIEEIRDGLLNIVKRFQPANIFFEKVSSEVGEKLVGWFDYKSHGFDEKIYNFMYVLPIEDKLMHGVFNSAMVEMDLWKPIVLKVIDTIKDLTLEKR